MSHLLERWAHSSCARIAWGPATLALEETRRLRRRVEEGEIDPTFFASELASLALPPDLPAEAWLIMVAVPRPAHRVLFEQEPTFGGPLEALVPPTYVQYRATRDTILEDLRRNALPGVPVDVFQGPYKALAVRMGLATYGRNNLAHVEGFGNYHQLCGFFTTAPLPERLAIASSPLLPACRTCRACQHACPTGAIPEDRLILRAERCLTGANEASGEWPPWVQSGHHRCLVGCLACQASCPMNPPLRIEDSGVAFTAQETRALKRHPAAVSPDVEPGITAKLERLGQTALRPVLGRNLNALAEAAVSG